MLSKPSKNGQRQLTFVLSGKISHNLVTLWYKALTSHRFDDKDCPSVCVWEGYLKYLISSLSSIVGKHF